MATEAAQGAPEPAGLAEELVGAVLDDLRDRRGFEAWWDEIDDDVQAELRDDLASIMRKSLAERDPVAMLLARVGALEVTGRSVVIIRVPAGAGDGLVELAQRMARAVVYRHPSATVLVCPEELVFGALELRLPEEPRT